MELTEEQGAGRTGCTPPRVPHHHGAREPGDIATGQFRGDPVHRDLGGLAQRPAAGDPQGAPHQRRAPRGVGTWGAPQREVKVTPASVARAPVGEGGRATAAMHRAHPPKVLADLLGYRPEEIRQRENAGALR